MQINARLPNHPYPRPGSDRPPLIPPLLPRRYPRLVRVEVSGTSEQMGTRSCVGERGRERFRCILGYVQWAPSSPRSLDAYPRIKSAYTLATLIWCNYYTLRGYTVVISTELFFFFFVVPSCPAFRRFRSWLIRRETRREINVSKGVDSIVSTWCKGRMCSIDYWSIVNVSLFQFRNVCFNNSLFWAIIVLCLYDFFRFYLWII